jgi:hypothetical protein
MKHLILLSLFSLSAFANPDFCSPYVTETTALISQSQDCKEATQMARACLSGSRHDVMLASSAIDVCRELRGGDEGMKPVFKACHQKFPNGIEYFFCVLEGYGRT